MKKLFFTAIAMLAFSAVSMANTIEIKEVEVTVEKTIITTTVEDDKRTPCDAGWIQAYENAGGYGEQPCSVQAADAWSTSHNCLSININCQSKIWQFLIFIMKKIILISILSISTFCSGQIKFGTVLYGKIMNTTQEIKGDADMKAWFAQTLNTANKIDYTLNFNKNEAYFFANPKLLDADENFNLAVINGNGKLQYYQNNLTKEYRLVNESRKTGKVILNNEQKAEWTLVNEIKTIDGYKCYKATTPKFNNGKKFDSGIVTAWYTPEIPFSFGPTGYSGLPGLILELQNDKATFFVKKINITQLQEPLIDKLLSEKAVSYEVYNQMVMGTLSSEQLEMMKEADDKLASEKK